jgi:hypothetical protein
LSQTQKFVKLITRFNPDQRKTFTFTINYLYHKVKPEVIDSEKVLFKKQLCAADPNPTECNTAIDTYWPGMAHAIFTYPKTPVDICSSGPTICTVAATDCPTW